MTYIRSYFLIKQLFYTHNSFTVLNFKKARTLSVKNQREFTKGVIGQYMYYILILLMIIFMLTIAWFNLQVRQQEEKKNFPYSQLFRYFLNVHIKMSLQFTHIFAQ